MKTVFIKLHQLTEPYGQDDGVAIVNAAAIASYAYSTRLDGKTVGTNVCLLGGGYHFVRESVDEISRLLGM